MVECAGLENRWARKGPVSSNLTSSVCLRWTGFFTGNAGGSGYPANTLLAQADSVERSNVRTAGIIRVCMLSFSHQVF